MKHPIKKKKLCKLDIKVLLNLAIWQTQAHSPEHYIELRNVRFAFFLLIMTLKMILVGFHSLSITNLFSHCPKGQKRPIFDYFGLFLAFRTKATKNVILKG